MSARRKLKPYQVEQAQVKVKLPPGPEARFPKRLYVQPSAVIAGEQLTAPYDGYTDLVGVEDSEYVAIYELKEVKQVRIETRKRLLTVGAKGD